MVFASWGPLGCALGVPLGPLGGLLGHLGSVWGTSCGVLGVPWGDFDGILRCFGKFWGLQRDLESVLEVTC